ncbi:MAG: biopolymer transporter ExbD [Alphaproteobacteria bacterium]|nr:biopolymer transporter ExbD [Alphaproteobacteria bacterium]
MKLREGRRPRRGRIEIIPMIDVMFFLLATFMLASLTLQNLHALGVDLPRGRARPLQAERSVTLTVTREGDIRLDAVPVTLDELGPALQRMRSDPEAKIIVNADSAAPSGTVVQAMLRARDAGAEHFLFAIKRE